MKKTITTLIMCLSFGFSHAEETAKVFARATKYHKTDKDCDPDTKKGLTSTQIKLRDSCDDTIGMVAVDPQQIPYGSLIYCPSNKRVFLACDVGGDVKSRKAAKNLAHKKGLSEKYRDALVLDFYAPKEIIDNHFDSFLVIENNENNFKHDLSRSQQMLHLDPKFWLAKVDRIYKEGDSDYPKELKGVISKLKGMKSS